MSALDKFKQDVDKKLSEITPEYLQSLFEKAGVKFRKKKKVVDNQQNRAIMTYDNKTTN